MTHDRVSSSRAAAALALLLMLPSGLALAGPLSGTWQQTSSNGGACPTCRISIKEDGSLASLAANNGWSADLSWLDQGGTKAAGRGRWKRDVGGAYAGKAIDVGVLLAGDVLTLTMSVSDGSIPGRIVGSYKRVAVPVVQPDTPQAGADLFGGKDAEQIRNGVRRYTCPEGVPLVVTFSEDAAIAAISIDGGPETRLPEKKQNVYANRQYSLDVHGRVATLRTPTGTDRCKQN